MPPVKAPPLAPGEFLARLEPAARAAGFHLERFGEAGGWPLLAATKRTPGPRPRIYLTAGIHGDEPASSEAILKLIEGGVLDSRAVWFVCPLLNPVGMAGGFRENAEGIDLNRDYRHSRSKEVRAHIAWLRRQPNFDLTLCFHEDWEATGFYLYELNPDGRPSLAQAMVAAASAHGPIDPSPLIDGREAIGGIIRPAADPATRELWPESLYLSVHHTRLSYTIEAPSAFPLEQRVAMLGAAASRAIELTARP